MIPLLKHVFFSLLFDENAAKRWLYGLLAFGITLASMIFVDGVEVTFTWTSKQWAAKVLTAVVTMALAMINPAGKVPKPESAPAP